MKTRSERVELKVGVSFSVHCCFVKAHFEIFGGKVIQK